MTSMTQVTIIEKISPNGQNLVLWWPIKVNFVDRTLPVFGAIINFGPLVDQINHSCQSHSPPVRFHCPLAFLCNFATLDEIRHFLLAQWPSPCALTQQISGSDSTTLSFF